MFIIYQDSGCRARPYRKKSFFCQILYFRFLYEFPSKSQVKL